MEVIFHYQHLTTLLEGAHSMYMLHKYIYIYIHIYIYMYIHFDPLGGWVNIANGLQKGLVPHFHLVSVCLKSLDGAPSCVRAELPPPSPQKGS